MRRAGGIASAVLLAAGAAWGQEAPLPGRMYVPPAILLGSSRMVGMGGAYAGVAEGGAGISANLASIAHRQKHEDGRFTLSPVFTIFRNAGAHDLDNDGVVDEVRASEQFLLGVQVRLWRLGLGGFVRSNLLHLCLTEACDAANRLDVALSNWTVAAGYALFDERLVASAGLVALQGTIAHEERTFSYSGFGVDVGLLYRPRGEAWRAGVSVRPPIFAAYSSGVGPPAAVGSHSLYEEIGAAGIFSLGASIRLGEGASAYNDLPPIDHVPPSRALDPRRPFYDMFRNREDPADGPVTVALQVDLIAPVRDAVALSTFPELVGVGGEWGVTPRAGVEWRVWPGRFRARAGSYLESSPFPGRGVRYHFTAGGELFVLRLVEDWSITLTADLAQKYAKFGFSIGAWR